MEKTSDEFINIINTITQIKKDLNSLTQRLRILSKTSTKTKKSNTISGFLKEVNVHDSMTSFLNVEKNTKVSRSFVNKKINEYIKEQDLQIQNSRQNFIIDDKLATIFDCEKGTQMHYFKMQSFLKHNYVKT